MDPYREGYLAYMNGIELDQNPHIKNDNMEDDTADQWEDGWKSAWKHFMNDAFYRNQDQQLNLN